MTRLSLSIASPSTTAADALVLGVYQGADGPAAADPSFDAAVQALALAGANGNSGTVTTIPAAGLVSAERIIGVGLGRRLADADTAEQTAMHRERVRQAAGAASRSAAGRKKVVSTLSQLDLGAAAEGHLLGAYVFDTYKAPGQPPVGQLVLSVPSADKNAKAELRRAEITVEAVAFARSLVNSAPNDLPPAVFADRASAAAREAGLTVEVLDEKAATAASWASGPARPGRPGWSGSATARPARRPRSRWSARASPSTPAACRSSRPRRWIR